MRTLIIKTILILFFISIVPIPINPAFAETQQKDPRVGERNNGQDKDGIKKKKKLKKKKKSRKKNKKKKFGKKHKRHKNKRVLAR
jgi:hypothetical protein